MKKIKLIWTVRFFTIFYMFELFDCESEIQINTYNYNMYWNRKLKYPFPMYLQPETTYNSNHKVTSVEYKKCVKIHSIVAVLLSTCWAVSGSDVTVTLIGNTAPIIPLSCLQLKI